MLPGTIQRQINMKTDYSLRNKTINFSVETPTATELETVAEQLNISLELVESLVANALDNIAYRAVGKVEKSKQKEFTFAEFLKLGISTVKNGEPTADDVKGAKEKLETAMAAAKMRLPDAKPAELSVAAWAIIFGAIDTAAEKYGCEVPIADEPREPGDEPHPLDQWPDYEPNLEWLQAACRVLRLAKARWEKAQQKKDPLAF
jgi:hypothetical protein